MHERCINDWDLKLDLVEPEECARLEIKGQIRDTFLPDFFAQFAEIVQGAIRDWGKPPDDLFLSSLESHLDWPVQGTRDYLALTSEQNPSFKAAVCTWMAEEMNWTFDPDNLRSWREVVDRAARTLCYVFCNRAIFYKAIRARYPDDLQPLSMPRVGKLGHAGVYDYFRGQFQRALNASGDYEPIFYPHVDDKIGALVFASKKSGQGWKGVFTSLDQYNFRQIPRDIIGGIFHKLIAPEERQKFGQFYTNEDIIDIINAFCIRSAKDLVLDPACGSGSVLVRAYHRKAWFARQKKSESRHQEHSAGHEGLLQEIYGCDVALFAVHLATLNLAAREIKDEENYPYIARRNFFEVSDNRKEFCRIPGSPGTATNGGRKLIDVSLPSMDAVIGNPPYVRQELIPRRQDLKRARGESKAAFTSRLKTSKDYLQELCSRLWPGLKLSGRSDLHCYFWPAAASLLKESGHFGFLTSSSWLDVEYGFALQGWALKNFKLLAIIESVDEPLFEDARIKTAVTILKQCVDQKERESTIVKFVRLERPVAEILGQRSLNDEVTRQGAAERLRKLILDTDNPYHRDGIRIMPVSQKRLWDDGVKAASLVKHSTVEHNEEQSQGIAESDYAAGKWGRFLRAPDLYFRLIHDYGKHFVHLGEIASIKRGITSGCDDFFMPRDVTERVLGKVRKGLPWTEIGLMTNCKRTEIESSKVRVIRAGIIRFIP